jgi:hypothetical protein
MQGKAARKNLRVVRARIILCVPDPASYLSVLVDHRACVVRKIRVHAALRG